MKSFSSVFLIRLIRKGRSPKGIQCCQKQLSSALTKAFTHKDQTAGKLSCGGAISFQRGIIQNTNGADSISVATCEYIDSWIQFNLFQFKQTTRAIAPAAPRRKALFTKPSPRTSIASGTPIFKNSLRQRFLSVLRNESNVTRWHVSLKNLLALSKCPLGVGMQLDFKIRQLASKPLISSLYPLKAGTPELGEAWGGGL